MLNHYIETKFSAYNLNEEEVMELIRVFRLKRYRRKERIFNLEDRMSTVGFLLEGSVYSSVIRQDGKLCITSFHYPLSIGEIVFNYEDYLQERLSQKIYHVYEDALLLLVDINTIKSLKTRFPKFYQLEMMIMELTLEHALKSIHIFQAKTIAEKVMLLKTHSPKTFQIFPYSYIASYLGIHRNTLNKLMLCV